MNRPPVLALAALSLLLASTAWAARPPVTGFVPVPGGRLFYEDRGTGPAVILVHGGMLDHRMWDPQVETLARRHRVVRYDVAGHGRSPVPEGAWRNYEHLDLLMQALKIDRASLVGLSLGGRVALDFAIAHPGKVRAMVLIGPGMSGFPFTGRDWRGLMAGYGTARTAGDAGKAAEAFLRAWLAGPHRAPAEVDPAVWSRVREMATPNALTLSDGEELEPPAVGRLGEITAPVLEIVGELDAEDIHLVTKLVERRVPGTRRVVIPGVAHMPGMEKPAEVNRLLVDFLQQPAAALPARPPLPAVQEMLEVEGGKLWVERTGEGEPLVLIHDGIVHAVGWDDVLPALASQFQVIRYDRRGWGRSTVPQAPFSPLRDLEAVLRHFGVQKAHLVGSSAGGGLAVDFALAHPEQVTTLTLVGSVVSGFPFTRHLTTRGSRLTPEIRSDPAAFRRYWSETDPYFVAPRSKTVRERLAGILEAYPQNLDLAWRRFALDAPPAFPRLGSIRVPTLVLAGEHDAPDVHAFAGAIAGGVPHARREIVEGAGHTPYLEQPAAFVAMLLGFLQSAPFLGLLDEQGPEAAAELFAAARAKDRAATLFPEEELNRRGYELLAAGKTKEAIAAFRLNAEAFPVSANTHDSLGEALLAAGDREGATASYRRALGLDPGSDSARAALRSLGALPEPVSPKP